MLFNHFGLGFAFAGIALARPQGPGQPFPADVVPLNTSVRTWPTTDLKLVLASTKATKYGRPQVLVEPLGQWTDQAVSYSNKLITNITNLERDTWAWAWGDTAIAGIYVPSTYNLQLRAASTSIFNDLANLVEGNLKNITRIGYNLREFPADPDVEGKADFQITKYYESNFTGVAIKPLEPRYILVGYPSSTELCYKYYGKPLPQQFNDNICDTKDDFYKKVVAVDADGKETGVPPIDVSGDSSGSSSTSNTVSSGALNGNP